MGRTTLRWLLALGLLGSLSAHAASPVWAVRGAHNTVYLAGSIHMLPADDAALPPGFARSYADSARLIMELDLGKFDAMEAMAWMMDHGALPAGTTLRGLLGEQRERVVDDPLCRGLLAVQHHLVDDLLDQLGAVDGVRLNGADLCWRAAGHLLFLHAVLRTRLFAVAHAGGVERAAHDLVTNAREILDASTANEHH